MRLNTDHLIWLILAFLLAGTACSQKSTITPTPTPSLIPFTQTPEPTATFINDPQSEVTPQTSISDPQATISATLSTTPAQATGTPQATSSDLQPTSTPASTIYDPQSTINNPQYLLSARFDYNQHSLAVTETITYTNTTGEAQEDMILIVPSHLWPGAFELKSIRWGNGEPIQFHSLRKHRLTVILDPSLQPNQKVTIILAYTLTLPPIPEPSDAAPQPFGYTLSQSNLVDWYAYVIPYDEGWVVRDPGLWGEYQVLMAGNYCVDLTLESAPPGLVVAASAPPVETISGDAVTYRYALDSARTFVLSISPSYHVFSQQVDLGDRTVTVYSYAYAYHLEAGQRVLEETAHAVALYSELFGPYPRDTLSVVEADFLDGMEYDGLYFLSKGFYNLYDGTPNGYLIAIAVHETAHQWWYGLVGNDQAQEPWLDEALCTFTERVYYERFYPEALSAWWQPYRVDYYDPRGLVGKSINDYGSYRDYRDGVYLHGQEFLQAVRERMGDEAFFAALREYVTRFVGQIATGQDLLSLLAAHAPTEINDLVEEYFGK